MVFGIIAVYVPIPTPVDRLVLLICPKCQVLIPVSSKFCPECGVDLRQEISEQRKKRRKDYEIHGKKLTKRSSANNWSLWCFLIKVCSLVYLKTH